MSTTTKLKCVEIPNGGGSLAIDPTTGYDPYYTDYVLTGTGDLLANYAVTAVSPATTDPTPMIRITYGATMGLNGNTITILGIELTTDQALSGKSLIYAIWSPLSSAYVAVILDSSTVYPKRYEGVTPRPLTTAGGTITLVPGVDKEYQYITGTGAMLGSYSFGGGGTPQDGDKFFIKYNGTFTLGAFNFTIFGVALTAPEVLAGDCMVMAYYDATGAAWRTQFIAAH